MMRIRHVLPQPAMGMLPMDPLNMPMPGVVNVAWNLAVQQIAAGHDVEIVAPGERRERQEIAGVRIQRLRTWPRWQTATIDLSYLAPLAVYSLMSQSVDVTHVHGNPYLLIRPRSGLRLIHFHNSPMNASPRYQTALSRADTVICCSDFIRQQIVDTVACPEMRLAVVLNGVEADAFAQSDRAAARQRYGIPNDEFVLLYVGRIGPDKGLHVVIDALEHLSRSGRTLPTLIVVGSGTLGYEGYQAAWAEFRAYEQKVTSRGEALGVRFVGEVPHRELPLLYQAADVFVCPSVYPDPNPLVNLEAAAAGVPVVASRIGGIPEAVLDGETGILVPPGDSTAMADAIHRLIDDHELRMRLGRAAREHARQQDWSVVTRQVLALYDQTSQQRRQLDTHAARVADGGAGSEWDD